MVKWLQLQWWNFQNARPTALEWYVVLILVHSVSQTRWATHRRQPSLLRYFAGHADAFQILWYGVYPVLSWSSRISFCITYIPVYSLSWQSVIVHSQNMPEPSQSSLFYDEIYLLQLSSHDIKLPHGSSLRRVHAETCCAWQHSL